MKFYRAELSLGKLSKLGDEASRLPPDQTRARLAEITQGQKGLEAAAAKLDTPKSAAAAKQAAR